MIASALYSEDTPAIVRELIKAGLVSGAIDRLCVYQEPPTRPKPSDGSFHLEMQELKLAFGAERVEVHPATELAFAGADDRSTFMALVSSSSLLAHRRLVTGSIAPICSMTYGNGLPTDISAYVAILMSALPQDIVVTSCAAETAAIRRGLECAEAFLESSNTGPAAKDRMLGISQVLPGIETSSFGTLDRLQCRSIFGFDSDSTIISLISQFAHESVPDIEPLLYAFRCLVDQTPKLSLILASLDDGNGLESDADELRQWLGLGSQARVLARLDGRLKKMLYTASDVVVSLGDNVSSAYDPTVLEAMSSGVPVIASDWGANRDIVVHGKTGFLVPTLWNEPAAALLSWIVPGLNGGAAASYLARRTALDVGSLTEYLQTLVLNSDLRFKFGEAGKRAALDRHSWSVIIEQYKAIWDEQQKRAAESRSDSILSWPLSFEAIFRSFASGEINFETEVVSSEKAIALVSVSGGSLLLRLAGPAEEFRNEVLRILDYCMFPRKMKVILDSGNEFTYEAIVWLLKKGFCETAQKQSNATMLGQLYD